MGNASVWKSDEEVAQLVKEIREELGMSQELFAEALGMPKGQAEVSRWERAKRRPGPKKMMTMARMIGKDVSIFQVRRPPLAGVVWGMTAATIPSYDMRQVIEALGTFTPEMLRRQAGEPGGAVLVRAFKKACADADWDLETRNAVDGYLNHLLENAAP